MRSRGRCDHDDPACPDVEKVCAVVVTFNRLALLRRCIEGLIAQTRRPDTILVVNNGSTDGTAEWLRERNDLLTITQENLGGAGGFHTGMRHAYDAGFAWVWMMDDDLALPPEALERLLEDARRGAIDVLNPLVVAEAEPEALAFGLSPAIQTATAARNAARDGLIAGLVNPFNGLLVSRAAIARIGFVRVEMFISGDEIEYISRALANGLSVATSTGVVCQHPRARYRYHPILFHRFQIELPEGRRGWIYIRNLAFINLRYRGVFALVRDAFKYCWYFLFNPQSESGALLKFLRYYFDGAADRYALPPERVTKGAHLPPTTGKRI